MTSKEAGKTWLADVIRKAVSASAVNGIRYGSFSGGRITSGKMARSHGSGESTILGYACEITRRQALRLAEEHLRPLNMGKVTPHSSLTLGQFVERHFVPNFLPTLKLSTQKRYRQTLDTHLLPAFGDTRLFEIGNLDVQRFVLQKMERGLGWETCSHLRNLMSKVFGMAKRWGFFALDNPAQGVELPEKKAVREKHVLSVQQIRALLMLLREPCRTMVLLGVLTGLRVGEILGLRWKAVDLLSGELRVEQAVYRGTVGSPKTKGSRRAVPLPESAINALSAFKGAGEELVFRTQEGTPYRDNNLLHRELKPAGVKIGAPWLSWHTLRRTHATLLQAAGGSLKDASAQLGHSKAIDHARNLHSTPARTSTHGGRAAGAIGDQW